jgi:hypothetical protein
MEVQDKIIQVFSDAGGTLIMGLAESGNLYRLMDRDTWQFACASPAGIATVEEE